MKRSKQPVGKSFSAKDILVIVLSLLALAGLAVIMKMSRNQEQGKQNELNNYNNQIHNSGMESGIKNDSGFSCIMINEVNQEGWIELYYTGKNEYTSQGLRVTVDGRKVYEENTKRTFRNGEYTVFQLDTCLGEKNGEVIELCELNGNIIEYLLLPEIHEKESYGTTKDGGIDWAFLFPSKGSGNALATASDTEQFFFSVPGGFYETAFGLKIILPEGYTVYYTTDGTEPTLASEKYEGPIPIQNRSGRNYLYATGMQENFYTPDSIDMGTVVRAILVDSFGTVLDEKIASYFVGLAGNSDYVNLPVLSITINPEYLFDYYEGIYVKGRSYEDALASGDTEPAANYYNGWKRPVYIEFFEKNKDRSYAENAKIKIGWDLSMEGSQKSFLISEVTELPKKNTQLSNYFNSYTNQLQVRTYRMDNAYKIREYAVNALCADYTEACLRQEPCIVFVDGEYWGLYCLIENFDQEYIQSTYSTGNARLAIVENAIAKEDYEKDIYHELLKLVISNDLSDMKNYRLVEEILDIQSYIDNICINMYLANADYGNTSKLWRSWEKEDNLFCDGRWRFVIPRLDNSVYNGFYGGKTTPSINSFLMPSVSKNPFFQSLLMNSEFRNRLNSTMNTLADVVFSNEKVDAVLSRTMEGLKKASISSYNRYNVKRDAAYYDKEIEKVASFFQQRAGYILKYTGELCEKGGDVAVIEEARLELAEKEMLSEQAQQSEQTE